MIVELNFTSRLDKDLTMGYLLKSRQLLKVFKILKAHSNFVYSDEVIMFLERFTPKNLKFDLERALALDKYRKDREIERNAHNMSSSTDDLKMCNYNNRYAVNCINGALLYGA